MAGKNLKKLDGQQGEEDMALPKLQSKHYKVEVFTPQFLLSGTLEPLGTLMPYLNNADRNTILLKQVSATPIDPSTSLPTFTADELWLPRKELIAVKFLDPISPDTMPLLANKEKLRVFLPHLVVQATFSRGADTKIHEIFDVISGDWVAASDAQIYPLHPTKCQFGRDAQRMLIIRRFIQFYQPVKE
jgi:hypothetical protein